MLNGQLLPPAPKKPHLWKTSSQRQISFNRKMTLGGEEEGRADGTSGMTTLLTHLLVQVGDPVLEVVASFLLFSII